MRRDVERGPLRGPAAAGAVDDHYLVEGEEAPEQPSVGARVAHTLQIVMIFVLAALSLAIFWLFGLVFNIL
jgi:hypothetical protein